MDVKEPKGMVGVSLKRAVEAFEVLTTDSWRFLEILRLEPAPKTVRPVQDRDSD